jgi:protein-S-isoprenylcysteine O-methyltransferase Ste14
MKDLPGTLLVATIWAYWFGVGVMIVRVRRESRTLGGLVPELRVEQFLWLLWVPLVGAWIVVPYLSLTHAHALWSIPAFAHSNSAYMAARALAAAVAVASLLLTSLCWSRMGRNWRMAVSTEKKGELITDGPFRRVRHPIYALSRLLMACSVVVVPTWPMLALAALHFALTQIKARHEESHMLRVHGNAYREYLDRVGRFVPKRPRSRRES